jgi:iron complex transport system substrate-binding protein
MNCLRCCMLAVACLCLFSVAGCADEYRTVVDSRGVAVQVPMEIERVVTISDGLVEGVMTNLDIEDKLVGLGSDCLPKLWEWEYPTVEGKNYTLEGMNTVNYLNPWIRDLPLVAAYGMPPNYEMLVSLDPDVVIIRGGDCTFWTDEDSMQQAINTIDALGIPLIVTYGPNTYDEPNMSIISEEIRIIGQVFGREEDAAELADYLENEVEFVRERTVDIPDDEKPRVLLFGLSPLSRDGGGAGDIEGIDTIESFFLEEIVNAKNAFQEPAYFKLVSAEHVLALDPDVIVLPTDWGYHPPRELYEAPYYQNLQELTAVKNRRVMALPWLPCNCDKRLEYPIEVMVMAKAAYPERFEDVNLAEWLLDFYQNIFNVDRETAEGLRTAQLMDWTLEESS